MRFPNAYVGVKKVFIAQILSLIAAIIVIPGSALATMGSVSVFGGGGTGMIVGGLILSIVFYICYLVYLGKAVTMLQNS